MLGFAWTTLRQAQEAFKNGRLEEAHRLLGAPGAMGHKGSWELLQQVAHGVVERGQRRLEHDDAAAAWNDVHLAEQIGTDSGAAKLRQALVQRGLAEVRAMLDAGDPARAVEMIDRLRERGAQPLQMQLFEDVAKGWNMARELAARGEFAQALHAAAHIVQLLPEAPAPLLQLQKDLEQKGKAFGALIVELHDAVQSENWRAVLLLADQVLALAPQQTEARKARARAWKSIEPSTAAAPPPVPILAKSDPVASTQRYLLWVDGIGGYLVCLGQRVTIGQVTPEASVDVPVFADISRLHAALTRDTEGYLLEALRPAQVNGEVVGRTLLRSGDRVTLGTSCQFQFVQPVPVSATARLDMVSGHRLPLAIDKVILMADTLVLGPGSQAHVVMPELTHTVVLYRNKDGLGVRCAGEFTIDNRGCKDRGVLDANSRVSGDDFAFAVELVGKQLMTVR